MEFISKRTTVYFKHSSNQVWDHRTRGKTNTGRGMKSVRLVSFVDGTGNNA